MSFYYQKKKARNSSKYLLLFWNNFLDMNKDRVLAAQVPIEISGQEVILYYFFMNLLFFLQSIL